MKWIGQHIYDQISRFRNDVYLEDIPASTETDMLVVDSAGKVSKRAIDAITVDVSDFMTNGVDNRVLTATGTDAINAEANLTFDGSTLTLAGDQTITNTVVDQIALDINASNTTGNIIDINAQALTTGSAIYIDCNSLGSSPTIHLDVDDAGTTTASRILHWIDYDKSSNTPNTIANSVTGSAVYLNDNATSNHAGSTHILTGHDSQIGVSNANGTHVISGHRSTITNGTAFPIPGGIQSYFSGITDGFGVDFKSISSANTADYFTIETTTNGATTLRTVDAVGAAAHFQIAADGDITLDAAGKNIYHKVNGATVNDFDLNAGTYTYFLPGQTDDYFRFAVGADGATTLTTVDVAAAAAHFEIEADGNIILDAAGDIALEAAGGDVTGDADNYTFTSSSSGKPLLTLKTTNTTKEASGELRFQKDANNTEDGESIGQISFYGENNAGTPETLQYGRVIGYMVDQIDGQEAGGLQISVAAYDGVLTSGLLLNGNTNVDDQVDVTIGSGSGSKTAIAGTIELGHASDTTIARAAAGVVTIEGDQIITSKPTTVGSGQSGQLGMQIARRTITQAEMNDLHNTPIAIVPALGANLVAIPVNGTIFVDRAANNTVSARLVIGYGSSTFANSIYFFKRFHHNISTDFHYGMDMYVGNFGTSMTAGVNTAINASADVAYTNNAFTSIDVYINYYVIDRS